MLQRRQWNSTPVLLPRKSHGRKSLVCCSPWGRYSRTRLSDFTFAFHFHALEKEMATHSSVLAWRIPGTGKPGGLPSVGSHRVGHDWSDLAAAAAWRDASGKILSEVGKNTSAKPSIKWPLNWAAVAGLGIQMCIWARLAGPGMNPWLQLLPELQGMGYPPNLVWWRPPMRPARRNFVIASVWAREITPRIRPGTNSSLPLRLCSALQRRRSIHTSSLLLVSLCLEFYSIWLTNIIPFNALAVFQTLDLMVNYLCLC